MPIVSINLAWLNHLVGGSRSPDVMREALEQIGCDVEDVVEILLSRCPQCGSLVENPQGQEEVKACGFCGFESETAFKPAGKQQAIRLDLLADRPDLFDVGGLARALRGTLGVEQGLPNYQVKSSANDLFHVSVDKSVGYKDSYRPFIECAVMSLPPLDEAALISIMKLQENLHWGVGRDRKLASIGMYDLDVTGNSITYRTMDPDKEPFVPLGMPGNLMSGRRILAEHPKGKAYSHLLDGFTRYPVLVGKEIMSMPPIINSDSTKLKKGTSKVFIDVTGISQAAVKKSLNTLVSSLCEIGGEVRSVHILPDGKFSNHRFTPDLKPRFIDIELGEAKRWLGLPLDEKSLAESLRKMRFDLTPAKAGGGRFTVSYPAYRTDIRHMVDLFEDVAIGYGYGNIEPRLVRSMTVGAPRPEEVLSDRVRQVLLGLGYSEIMSLPLTTEEHQFERLRLDTPEKYAQVTNPKLKAYNVVRGHLLGGIFEALRENRRRPMPQRMFEIDNIAALDDSAETGAAEYRKVALAEIGRESGFATARSVTDALIRELGWQAEYKAIEHSTFVSGRAAEILVAGKSVGVLGEVHPEVLTNFGLTYPVALAELTLERVC